MALPTGYMMTKVMKIARAASTWLGGMVWMPMAWRMKWKTMMIRVKEVMVRRMAGARERMVMRKRISNRTETCSGSA